MKTEYANAVVGQSGGPTAAINATLSGVVRGATLHGERIATLFGMKHGIEGLLADDLVDLTAFFGTSEEKLRELEQTPAAALGSCRLKLPDPESDPEPFRKIAGIFRRRGIRYFFYIGGNDSMDTVAKLAAFFRSGEEGISVIGVPKTIDNDLVGTDHTPGFGSAAKYIAVTVGEILCDCAVYRIPAVTVIELMGRDSGWLTAAAALGRMTGSPEPDLIYLPERAFDTERFLADVHAALRRHPDVVVAVSEGVRDRDGKYIASLATEPERDRFGHRRLGGVGTALSELVRDRIGCKTRSIELNLPQRCGAHLASLTDIQESVGVGKAAVFAAVSGVTGEVMTIVRCSDNPYRVEYSHLPAGQIANRVRLVDDRFINAAGNQVTDECCAYLFPLIQGEVPCRFLGGLPVHLSIR